MKPILKWAGSKRATAAVIASHMPARIPVYRDAFVGAGSVFLELYNQGRVERAILSDANEELIVTYQAIRSRVDKVIAAINRLPKKGVTEAKYNAVRDSRPTAPAEVAARMLFLNKTCYNGLYRVNKSKGEFNVSWGRHESWDPDFDNLREFSKALQIAELRCCDFRASVERAESGEVVYLDPPYIPVSETSSFVGYTQDGFSLTRQIELGRCFASLATHRNCLVLASNSTAPLARAIYESISDTTIYEIRAARAINSKGDKRGKVREILAMKQGGLS